MPMITKNRRATYDYELLERFEAGIKLNGQEVKSVKTNRVSLKGSFVVPHEGELHLINAYIPHYQEQPGVDFDERRSRKLLMSRREIDYLIGKKTHSGLTIVPVSMYTKKGRIKLEIALAKGKKKRDKRRDIAERENKRRIERELKRNI